MSSNEWVQEGTPRESDDWSDDQGDYGVPVEPWDDYSSEQRVNVPPLPTPGRAELPEPSVPTHASPSDPAPSDAAEANAPLGDHPLPELGEPAVDDTPSDSTHEQPAESEGEPAQPQDPWSLDHGSIGSEADAEVTDFVATPEVSAEPHENAPSESPIPAGHGLLEDPEPQTVDVAQPEPAPSAPTTAPEPPDSTPVRPEPTLVAADSQLQAAAPQVDPVEPAQIVEEASAAEPSRSEHASFVRPAVPEPDTTVPEPVVAVEPLPAEELVPSASVPEPETTEIPAEPVVDAAPLNDLAVGLEAAKAEEDESLTETRARPLDPELVAELSKTAPAADTPAAPVSAATPTIAGLYREDADRTQVIDAQGPLAAEAEEEARLAEQLRVEKEARDQRLGLVATSSANELRDPNPPARPGVGGFASFGLLVLRLVTAGILAVAAMQILSPIDATAEYLAKTVIPYPREVAWGLGIALALMAVLLVIGLGVRAVGVLLTLLAVLSLMFVRWGPFPIFASGVEGFVGDKDLILAAIGILFFSIGGGRAGIDGAISKARWNSTLSRRD